mgnify:FL=1
MTQHQRRIILIQYLLNESERYRDIDIPGDIAEQKKLFRSLMNVRTPKTISDDFIRIQDEYLKGEIAEKGITDADTLPFADNKISLWQGDITTLKCGAIVNAANSAMLGCFVPCHKCIDNAIHTFSGIELRLECAEIMEKQGFAEQTGKAKITKAYNLPCDYILHTVGPIVGGRLTEKHCTLLASCYHSCLDLAERYGIKSVAFPCISTGEFHFPNEKAAEIAINTVREKLKTSTVERVIFNVFKNEDKWIYEKLLG